MRKHGTMALIGTVVSKDGPYAIEAMRVLSDQIAEALVALGEPGRIRWTVETTYVRPEGQRQWRHPKSGTILIGTDA